MLLMIYFNNGCYSYIYETFIRLFIHKSSQKQHISIEYI